MTLVPRDRVLAKLVKRFLFWVVKRFDADFAISHTRVFFLICNLIKSRFVFIPALKFNPSLIPRPIKSAYFCCSLVKINSDDIGCF